MNGKQPKSVREIVRRTESTQRWRAPLLEICLLMMFCLMLVPMAKAAEGALILQLQNQLQKLSADKAMVEAEKSELESRIEALEAELAPLKAAQASSQNNLTAFRAAEARYNENTSILRTRAEKAEAGIGELSGRFRELATTLKEVESDRQRLREVANGHEQRIIACEANNQALVEVANDVLTAYEDRGWFDSLMEREPLTGIARVRLENNLASYRERVDALYLNSGGDPLAQKEQSADLPQTPSTDPSNRTQ